MTEDCAFINCPNCGSEIDFKKEYELKIKSGLIKKISGSFTQKNKKLKTLNKGYIEQIEAYKEDFFKMESMLKQAENDIKQLKYLQDEIVRLKEKNMHLVYDKHRGRY
jgi:hypothetical protein